jgi:hypothetical protein
MKIKTSTLKRIHKEYVYYQKETEKEQTRVESMKAAGADPHDLRQAVSMHHCTPWCQSSRVSSSTYSAQPYLAWHSSYLLVIFNVLMFHSPEHRWPHARQADVVSL